MNDRHTWLEATFSTLKLDKRILCWFKTFIKSENEYISNYLDYRIFWGRDKKKL